MSRIDFDLLNRVIKELGLAAVDPTLWPYLMTEICRATGTTGAGLLQSDIRTSDIPMTESAQDIFASYFRNGLHLDDVRAVRGAPKLLSGSRVISDKYLFVSEQEMDSDPLYADLGRYGFKWWSAIGFWSDNAHWGLTLQRKASEGMFEEVELVALAMLSERLTETATLSKAVGRKIVAGITNAFSLIDQPAIALDRRGRVIDINARAAALFDDEFAVRSHEIFVKDIAAKQLLSSLITKLQIIPDAMELKQDPIVVRRRLKSPIIIRTLPIDGPAHGPFLGARAILTISAIEARQPIDPALLIRLFGLTPAESKLAALLGAGTSLNDAAEQLARTKHTVRTQLKNIFAKTGTNRQGELSALLGSVR